MMYHTPKANASFITNSPAAMSAATEGCLRDPKPTPCMRKDVVKDRHQHLRFRVRVERGLLWDGYTQPIRLIRPANLTFQKDELARLLDIDRSRLTRQKLDDTTLALQWYKRMSRNTPPTSEPHEVYMAAAQQPRQPCTSNIWMVGESARRRGLWANEDVRGDLHITLSGPCLVVVVEQRIVDIDDTQTSSSVGTDTDTDTTTLPTSSRGTTPSASSDSLSSLASLE